MKRKFIIVFCVVLAALLGTGLAYPALAAGSAPVAENLELRTYRNVSVSGQLSAFDPENDVTEYQICTQPVKGYIELATDGSFVYTPSTDKKALRRALRTMPTVITRLSEATIQRLATSWAQMGVMRIFWASGSTMGPPADRL